MEGRERAFMRARKRFSGGEPKVEVNICREGDNYWTGNIDCLPYKEVSS